MVDVSSEVTIACPIHRVASYAADPSNAPEWYVNIRSVEWRTPPPVGKGSQVAFEARFLGRTLNYTYEIVEYVPDERLAMRTAEGPFPMETTYTWAARSPTVTTMTLRNRGEPSGFGTVVSPLLAPAMRRANRKDLARFKSILESASPG